MNTNDLPSFFSPKDQETISYFRNLFGDKLKLYQYCESQLSRVAFANSIFIAAIAVIISGSSIPASSIPSNGCTIPILLYILYFFTVLVFIPFVVSLCITLRSAIPNFFGRRLSYGKADHSSIYGIQKFKNAEDYKSHISKLTTEDAYNEIIAQIYNMNDTIIHDYKKIDKAVRCDIIGLVFFMCYLIFKFGLMSKLIPC